MDQNNDSQQASEMFCLSSDLSNTDNSTPGGGGRKKREKESKQVGEGKWTEGGKGKEDSIFLYCPDFFVVNNTTQ